MLLNSDVFCIVFYLHFSWGIWELLVARRLIVECFDHEGLHQLQNLLQNLLQMFCSWWRPSWSKRYTIKLLATENAHIPREKVYYCSTSLHHFSFIAASNTSINTVYLAPQSLHTVVQLQATYFCLYKYAWLTTMDLTACCWTRNIVLSYMWGYTHVMIFIVQVSAW